MTDHDSTSTGLRSREPLRPGLGLVQLDVPARVVVKTLVIAALVAFGVVLLLELRTLLLQLAVAAFLAVAIDPLVQLLHRRGLGRGRALAVVMLGFLGALAVLAAVLVPPLVDQGQQLDTAAPQIVEDLRRSALYERLNERFGIAEAATDQAERIPGIVSSELGTVLGAVLTGIFGTITVLFLTLFMLAGGRGTVQGIVQLVPRLAEQRWWSVVQGAYRAIGAYVTGALIIAVIGGSVVVVSCLVLDLPYALPLGLWMMLLEVVPLIGATIGAVPAILVAFAVGGQVDGLVMILIIGVYQQVENVLIQPRVQGKAASLSPLVIFVSVLTGAELLGVLGALVAVPIAGVVQIVLRQFVVRQGTTELELPALAPDAPEAPDADGDGEPGVRNDPSSRSGPGSSTSTI